MSQEIASTDLLESEEREVFELNKKVVTDSMVFCMFAGKALGNIKANPKWYEADGFDSFQAFCNHEWGYTKRYCDQLILDSDVIASLPESLQKFIQTERAARELGKVPPALRAAVVEAATAGGKKKATAAAISSSTPSSKGPPPRSSTKPKSGPPPRPKGKPRSGPPPRTKAAKKIVDFTECEVPVEVLGIWNRSKEAQDLITYASSIKSKLKKAQETDDPLFKTVDFTGSLSELAQLIENLREAVPYAVCPTCGGKTPKGCLLCKGRGFVSEFKWNNVVPKEVRDMRNAG